MRQLPMYSFGKLAFGAVAMVNTFKRMAEEEEPFWKVFFCALSLLLFGLHVYNTHHKCMHNSKYAQRLQYLI